MGHSTEAASRVCSSKTDSSCVHRSSMPMLMGIWGFWSRQWIGPSIPSTFELARHIGGFLNTRPSDVYYREATLFRSSARGVSPLMNSTSHGLQRTIQGISRHWRDLLTRPGRVVSILEASILYRSRYGVYPRKHTYWMKPHLQNSRTLGRLTTRQRVLHSFFRRLDNSSSHAGAKSGGC